MQWSVHSSAYYVVLLQAAELSMICFRSFFIEGDSTILVIEAEIGTNTSNQMYLNTKYMIKYLNTNYMIKY